MSTKPVRLKYRYFVSFSFQNEDGSSGYGNCEVLSKHKLNNIDKLKETANNIQAENKISHVVILNFQRMKAR